MSEVDGHAVAAEAISTGRLDLLPLLVEHAEEMAAVLSDPALHTFVSWLNWVIRLRDEDRLTGTVQATVGPTDEGPVAEIAWMVGTPWQGRGIATEAARGLVDWLRRQPVRAVIAHIHPGHQASAAVAIAAGLAPTDEWQDGELRWRRSIE
jgi:RimJ/RimL family protein N-acetyltransferase